MATASNSYAKGNSLECRIRDLFETEIEADRFWAKKQNCKVFWKKGYYSKDRGTEIIFDVAIEIYLPGARDYSCLVLIECKNYTHSVPVDDAEEFFAKVQQVAAANVKAVIVSTASFQKGAREFAKSKGMGLMRYFGPEDFKWELKRSPSASAQSTTDEHVEHVGAVLSMDRFHSLTFDLYLQSPRRDTNSLWDFFEDLVLDSALSQEQVRRVVNQRNKSTCQIPFYDKDELESKAADILSALEYSGGEVDLELLCKREAAHTGLTVEMYVPAHSSITDVQVLGRITFGPPVIQVFAVDPPHRGRDRFTLAHELSHHLLGHGRFLVRESCDDKDFALQRATVSEGGDVARMEFQANFLAACMLMPRTYVIEDFHRLVRAFGISDRGFGALFVDNQPCNIHNFDVLTNELMRCYGVSRSAVKIRLESLGLLRDARNPIGLRSVQTVFTDMCNK